MQDCRDPKIQSWRGRSETDKSGGADSHDWLESFEMLQFVQLLNDLNFPRNKNLTFQLKKWSCWGSVHLFLYFIQFPNGNSNSVVDIVEPTSHDLVGWLTLCRKLMYKQCKRL